MIAMDDSAIYLERAEMHEQLAAATSDVPARKMHLAMAAEYRRKASEAHDRLMEVGPLANSGSVMLADSPV